MDKWFTLLGRAGLMGLAWASCWLLPSMIAGSIYIGELEPEHIGGALYAGFPGGFLFSLLAGLASGRRRPENLSLALAAAYGAVSGAIIGALPFLLGDQHAPGDRPLWLLPAAVICGMAVVCAVSAVITSQVARWSNRQVVSSSSAI